MQLVIVAIVVVVIIALVVFGSMCFKQDSKCNDRHQKAMDHTKNCVKQVQSTCVCKNGKDGKPGKDGKDGVCPPCPPSTPACQPPAVVYMASSQPYVLSPDTCGVTTFPWDQPYVLSPSWTFLPPDTVQLTDVSGEGRYDLEVSVELTAQTSCSTSNQPNGEANVGYIWLRIIPATGPDANTPVMIAGTMRAITASATSTKRLYHMNTSVPVKLGDKIQVGNMVSTPGCSASITGISYSAPNTDAITSYADFVLSRTGCIDDLPLIIGTEPVCSIVVIP